MFAVSRVIRSRKCITTLTSAVNHLRTLAPVQLSFENMSQGWRALSNTVSAMTGPVIESTTSAAHSAVLNHCRNRTVSI